MSYQGNQPYAYASGQFFPLGQGDERYGRLLEDNHWEGFQAIQGRVRVDGGSHPTRLTSPPKISLAVGDIDSGLDAGDRSTHQFSAVVNRARVLDFWSSYVNSLVELQVNGNEVFHRGNMGHGSGLDADTLDGLQADQFLRSDTNELFTAGTLTFTQPGGGLVFNTSSTNEGNDYAGIRFRSPNADTGEMELWTADNRAEDFVFRQYTNAGGTENQLEIFRISSDNPFFRGKKVWHEDNDGAGSGLDADLLQGRDPFYYQQSIEQNFLDSSDLLVDEDDKRGQSPGFYAWANTLPVGGPDGVRYASLISLKGGFGGDGYILLDFGANSGGSSDYVGGLWTKVWDWKSKNTGGRWSSKKWAKYWHTENMGSGSGLDADLLDGLDSEQFLRSDVDTTLDGNFNIVARSPGQIRELSIHGEGSANNQVASRVFLGQSTSWGGGIEFNGDTNILSTTGAPNDHVTFYRRQSGQNIWTAAYRSTDDKWRFKVVPDVLNEGAFWYPGNDDPLVHTAGDDMEGGLRWDSVVSDPLDLSQHIRLHSSGYGLSVTDNNLNIVSENNEQTINLFGATTNVKGALNVDGGVAIQPPEGSTGAGRLDILSRTDSEIATLNVQGIGSRNGGSRLLLAPGDDWGGGIEAIANESSVGPTAGATGYEIAFFSYNGRFDRIAWTAKYDLNPDRSWIFRNTPLVGENGDNAIWHQGNMGASSGLDSDLLDGQEGSFYQNASNLVSGTLPAGRLSGVYNVEVTGKAGALRPARVLSEEEAPQPVDLAKEVSSQFGKASLFSYPYAHSGGGNLQVVSVAGFFGDGVGTGAHAVQLALGSDLAFRRGARSGWDNPWNKLFHNNNLSTGDDLTLDDLDASGFHRLRLSDSYKAELNSRFDTATRVWEVTNGSDNTDNKWYKVATLRYESNFRGGFEIHLTTPGYRSAGGTLVLDIGGHYNGITTAAAYRLYADDHSFAIVDAAYRFVAATETDASKTEIYAKIGLDYLNLQAAAVNGVNVEKHSNNSHVSLPSDAVSFPIYTTWNSNAQGSGTGMDADKVDNYEASELLDLANATGTFKRSIYHEVEEGGYGMHLVNQNNGVDYSVWRVEDWTSGSRAMGFNLYYVGSGQSNDNSLKLFSDNVGDEMSKLVYEIKQDGILRLEETPRVSDNQVWHAGNMGPNSGLNADLLDGAHGTQYLRRDMDSTFNGNLTIDAGTNTDVVIKSQEAGESTLALYGYGQGTGRVFVGQSALTGGGIMYAGDGTPSDYGVKDNLALYRLDSNREIHWTLKQPFNSDTWTFRVAPEVEGNGVVYHAGNANLLSEPWTAHSLVLGNGEFTERTNETEGTLIYDASTGLGLYYGSSGSGIPKGQATLLDTSNTVVGDNLNLTGGSSDSSRPTLEILQGSGSGLDADFLDGQHGAFYQNAANLNTGTLPNARLSGDYSFSNLTLSDKLTTRGIELGSDSGSSQTDVSRHLDLYGTTYGIGVTRNTLNLVANSGSGTVSVQANNLDLKGTRVLTTSDDARFVRADVGNTRIPFGENSPPGDFLSFDEPSNTYDFSSDSTTRLTVGGNTVWHEGNDGDGSGLNADKVDGEDASELHDAGNLTGTAPRGVLPLATATLSGTVRRASTNLTAEGTNDDQYVTPAGVTSALSKWLGRDSSSSSYPIDIGGKASRSGNADKVEGKDSSDLIRAAVDANNPVETIREFRNDSRNPSEILDLPNSTWELFGLGKMTIGVGNGFTAGDFGGSTEARLFVRHLPPHRHYIFRNAGDNDELSQSTYTVASRSTSSASNSDIHYNMRGYAGGEPDIGRTSTGTDLGLNGDSFSIMNPYVVIHRWVRTA